MDEAKNNVSAHDGGREGVVRAAAAPVMDTESGWKIGGKVGVKEKEKDDLSMQRTADQIAADSRQSPCTLV